MPPLLVIASNNSNKKLWPQATILTIKKISISASLLLLLGSASYSYADSMSALIAQKSVQPQIASQSQPQPQTQPQSKPQISVRYKPAQVAAPSTFAVPSARISTRSSIKRASSTSPNHSNTTFATSANNNSHRNNNAYSNNSSNGEFNRNSNNSANLSINNNVNTNVNSTRSTPASNTYRYNKPSSAVKVSYRYPEVQRKTPAVLPAFLSGGSLSGSYDNVDSEYLPLLSRAETQSSMAAREVIGTARKMALNERTIIQGGCWDYLDAVFKRAGVTRNTLHKGTYAEGPYASSNEIELGDWLYYINHGYNGVEHSGLFVGWVDEAAKQALMLSYAGENRQEPARYRVYDLSNVYQIMRPSV